MKQMKQIGTRTAIVIGMLSMLIILGCLRPRQRSVSKGQSNGTTSRTVATARRSRSQIRLRTRPQPIVEQPSVEEPLVELSGIAPAGPRSKGHFEQYAKRIPFVEASNRRDSRIQLTGQTNETAGWPAWPNETAASPNETAAAPNKTAAWANETDVSTSESAASPNETELWPNETDVSTSETAAWPSETDAPQDSNDLHQSVIEHTPPVREPDRRTDRTPGTIINTKINGAR